jgi:hypothetical protein
MGRPYQKTISKRDACDPVQWAAGKPTKEISMLRHTLVAVAAAVLAGSVGASYAQEVQKTTVIHPAMDDGKVVVKKKTVVRHPGVAKVVHKKTVVHDAMTGQKVVHRATVVRTPTSKTTVVKPTTVETERQL